MGQAPRRKHCDEPAPGGHVCPWWCAYTFDNFLRRLVHDPSKLLAPYVGEGMTVIDVGCGMGHFTIGMASLVGSSGRVIAVDLQPKMLEVTMKRASRRGLAERIVTRQCTPGDIGIDLSVDFALAFWMVHEVPEPQRLFGQLAALMRPDARLLYAEPSFHVGERLFREILKSAAAAGLARLEEPLAVRFSRAALLRRERRE